MNKASWFRARSRQAGEDRPNAATLYHLADVALAAKSDQPPFVRAICGRGFHDIGGSWEERPVGHWPDAYACKDCVRFAMEER